MGIRGGHRTRSLASWLVALSSVAFCPHSESAATNSTLGSWSPVENWPLIAIHAVLMPDGRVLTYGTTSAGKQTAAFIYDVWDSSAGLGGGHVTLPNTTGTDLFCSSQVVLPAGNQVFIAGGDNWTGTSTTNTGNNNSNVFDYESDTLTRQNNLQRARWYSTSTVLPDGRVYVQGGSGGGDRPEIRELSGVFRLLNGANTSSLIPAYPRNFVAPDGRIFGYDNTGKMFYVNFSGSGAFAAAGQFSGPTGRHSTAAMFRPGRILQFGGFSRTALIVDITSGSPVVTSTQSLSSKRLWVTATILADGKVLATGGSEVANELVGVNNNAEIWDPNTGLWTLGAAGSLARLYHSTALLLPDASVLVAGGGAGGNAPLKNTNAEIYYPPYLYDANGNWASRPDIQSAPSFIQIGGSFDLTIGDSASAARVVLVKSGSVSHSFNMDQRFIEAVYQQNGNRLTVQAPSRSTDAPPGFYLIFVLNSAGTPSIARIARIGAAGESDPGFPPVLENPGNQTGQVGVALTLQLAATDVDSVAVTYGATGLPPGVTINSVTGLISGSPTAVGIHDVVVSASDGNHGDSENFQWTISQAAASFTLYAPPSPAPVQAGVAVTLEASVDGGVDLLFKWDFDDGTPETDWSPSPSVSHAFSGPGIYYVTVTAIDAGGLPQISTVVVTVHLPLTAQRPSMSGNLAVEDRGAAGDRLWVVNQDNDSVSVINTVTNARLAEIAVGAAPRTLTFTAAGEIWIANKQSASISAIDPASLAVVRTIPLPYASQPFGIAAAPTGNFVYAVLEATGKLLKIDASSGTVVDSVGVGANPRHVSVSGDGELVYVSRFITPPLTGENGPVVQTAGAGGEVVVVDASSMLVQHTIRLRHSDKADSEDQGRGIPNYLGAVAISPDGTSAWVPSKQDNIKRGIRRDGTGLTFQNTVRAISSRIDLIGGTEDHPKRIDHDNSGVASAIAYDRFGIYMFVALETSREIAVVDANSGWEIFRFNAGLAPQGLALSTDGRKLYVNNAMERTVGAFDLSKLLDQGMAEVISVATISAIGSERLSAQVLKGKQLFYDARDSRLARDAYISCAACHNDGGHDGRVWDLTGFGEGLRNTISLRGRGSGQGFLHWSNNFDEVQDFEGQIRALSGGTGLLTDAQYNPGTRSQPLGDPKEGLSADLDALAAYVASLNTFAPSPYRNADGSLTAAGAAGRALFETKNCGSCHGGTAFTNSGSNNPQDIGTITVDSGKRLNSALSGIDIPTLRDVWNTAPYLHLGSAQTLGDAIGAHSGIAVTDSERSDLVAYLTQIGSQEATAPYTAPPPPVTTPNTGTGLSGRYFNNKVLTGTYVLKRTEAVNFDWIANAPGPGVNKDNFSVRWIGKVEAPATGNYTFQTSSNDGVRLWINGVLVVDNWTNHDSTTNNSPALNLTGNQRYAITMEFYDDTGAAEIRLKWKQPGGTTFAAVPKSRLYTN